MKRTLLPALLFAVLTALVPLAAALLAAPARAGAAPAESSAAPAAAAGPGEGAGGAASGEVFRVLDESTGEVLDVPAREWMIGAVAAEMPLSYEDEALAAQAVAARSYALACRAREKSGAVADAGADFSADPQRRLGFLTQEVMRLVWGADFEANYARLAGIVDGVLGETLTWQGQPALACYHALSNGWTQSAADVWGGEVAYLVPAESSADVAAEGFEQTVTLTAQEMREQLSAHFAGIDFSAEPQDWFGLLERNAEGYVTSAHIGGVACRGQDVRTALSLRSADFSVTWTGEEFSVTTRGWGHGVGMSQYGANAMASAGAHPAQRRAQPPPGAPRQRAW